MGAELSKAFPEARRVFDAADDALKISLSRLCFEGPEPDLKLTANTQPAILVASIAAHAIFSARAPAPAMMAGHSLGEYTALVAAGAVDLGAAVQAVRARGQFMQEAVPDGVGAMAAVLGLASDKVKAICELAADGQVLSPANYNSPEQTVVAGHAPAVERAAPRFKDAGAKRVISLAVSAPFHCALMDPVKPRLSEVLGSIRWRSPACPVVSNVEAKPNADAARIVPLLVEQVSRAVRWVECVQELQRHGIRTVVELGPGRVLSGLIRRISKDLKVFNVEDPRSLAQTLAAVTAQ